MRKPQISVSPPLPLGVYARRPSTELPFPLDRSDTVLFARARHGLWQGVYALGLQPGDEVLVPAYHHGSGVEALLRAGLVLRYYGLGPTLEPDTDELDSVLNPRVRALHLIHYLGFPQDGARWRAWCDERSLLLLEDAAQAWLSSDSAGPVGSHGDLAIFCIYKTIGVPDGGALVVRTAAPRPETVSPIGFLALAKCHALWAMQRSRAVAAAAAAVRSNGAYIPEEDFALGDPGSAPTASTLRVLPRLVDRHIALKRRANYERLLDVLGGRVPPPFDQLPEGSSPFALPVETDDKRRLLDRLAEHGIEGLDFWSVPHPSLEVDRFPEIRDRRARTVALPVHQELRLTDVERIAAAAVERPSRRKRPAVRLEPIGSFEEVADQWDELALRSGNVFATREWLSLWWEHFGRAKRLHLSGCLDADGRLVAILPLYLWDVRGLRVFRLLGHGTADQLGPICAPEDRRTAAAGLRLLLGEIQVGWDFFLGELLPGHEAWSSLVGGRTVARDGYPVLRFQHDTWADFLASSSRRFRKELSRTERRLSEAHEVRIRLADDAGRLEEDLDMLFALHRMRWTDDESPFGANEPFHRQLAAEAFRRGWLYLWFAYLDGRPVAAEYTFRFAGAQHHYQGGRDPEWERLSVGSHLFAYSVREAFEAGLRECRFLRGRETYKYRFANEDPELETVGIARGTMGDAALMAMLALRGWHDVGRLRRMLVP